MTKCHCGKQASFNILGQKAVFCAEHKEPNMINVNNRVCEFNGCRTIPVFNIRGESRARFCAYK